MLEFHGKSIEAAIFDMDGTMFDTERLRFQTITQAAQELAGVTLAESLLIDCLGLSATSAAALTRERHGPDFPYEAVRRRADELELAHVRARGVPIKPGLLPVLERLRRAGLKMAVATSSRRAIAEEYLINAGVFKYFDLLVCGDEVTRGKPDPEIFERAAAALNCATGHALMLEDSENGLRSAIAAGGQAVLLVDIKPPAEAVAAGALARYDSLSDFQADLTLSTPNLPMPATTEPFAQAVNLKQVGIHGFGAMGGGYLAQVLSHWDGYTRPARIVASTGNALLREAVNAFGGQYSVRYGSIAFDQSIERIHMVDAADRAAVAQMYRDSELVALCLPEQAIPSQAPVIAQGLASRLADSGRPLTVLVVLNKVGAAAFVRQQVAEALRQQLGASQARRALAQTEFVETVVTRIVSKLTDEALLRQLRIKRDLYERNVATLRENAPAQGTATLATAVSQEQARTLAPIVSTLRHAGMPAGALAPLHLVLFNSETDMPLYAQAGSPLLAQLRQVETVPDIRQIQLLKNRLWNGTHAIIGWQAALLGHPAIGHAMGDERVTALMERLLTQELAPAFGRLHPELTARLPRFIDTFRARCASAFKDPCTRVGRDPLRKLQRSERVVGSLVMTQQAGVPAPALALGAALGVHYALVAPAEHQDAECQRIRALYAQRESLRDVLAWQGDYNGRAYDGLRPDERAGDAALLAEIERAFEALQSDSARALAQLLE